MLPHLRLHVQLLLLMLLHQHKLLLHKLLKVLIPQLYQLVLQNLLLVLLLLQQLTQKIQPYWLRKEQI